MIWAVLIAALLWLGLFRLRPNEEWGWPNLIRRYVLLFIPAVATPLVARELLRASHQAAWAFGDALILMTLAILSTLPAIGWPRWLAQYAEIRWPWSIMSPAARRVGIVCFAAAMLSMGIHLQRQYAHAYDLCRDLQGRAFTADDTLRVAATVPDSDLARLHRRYGPQEHAFSCAQVLAGQ